MFLRTFSTGNYVYVAFIDDKTLSELYVHAFSIYSIKKDYTLRWTGTLVRIPYPFVCSLVLVWIKLRVCMRKIFHVCVCVCVRVCLSVGRSFCLFVGHSVCLCLFVLLVGDDSDTHIVDLNRSHPQVYVCPWLHHERGKNKPGMASVVPPSHPIHRPDKFRTKNGCLWSDSHTTERLNRRTGTRICKYGNN